MHHAHDIQCQEILTENLPLLTNYSMSDNVDATDAFRKPTAVLS